MKKLVALVICAMMMFSLVACSSGTTGTTASTENSTATEEAQAQTSDTQTTPDTVYTITVALHTSAEGIEAKTVEKFKELVEARTNGGIQVEIFAGGALGTEQENLTQIKSGEIQMAVFGDVMAAQVYPEYNANSIPFVFPSIEAVEEFRDGPVGDLIRQTMIDRNNMMLVGLQRRAPRMLTANKEINTPADLAGLKLRVPETPFWVTVWQSMGAIPTPVNWSEVYTALQTGVVEAQENPIETYYTAGLQEVQKYTMLTSHVITHYSWCVNVDFYESLPDEYKTAFDESAAEALAEVNNSLYDRQDEVIELLKAEGHTFIEVDIDEFREAAKDGILECAAQLAPEAQEIVYSYLND